MATNPGKVTGGQQKNQMEQKRQCLGAPAFSAYR
jgi:hypothetical protein